MGKFKGSYDRPMQVTYSWPGIDFGDGNKTGRIKPPAGAKFGRIEEIGVNVTETFNQVTTPGYVRVGTVDDADAYAELNMGAAAINTYYGSADNDPFDAAAKDHIDMDRDAAAGTAITYLAVAFVAPTGGTPAGIGTPMITVSWWQ